MKKSSIVELTFKTDMYNNFGLSFFKFQLLREGSWVHDKNTDLRKHGFRKQIGSNIEQPAKIFFLAFFLTCKHLQCLYTLGGVRLLDAIVRFAVKNVN